MPCGVAHDDEAEPVVDELRDDGAGDPGVQSEEVGGQPGQGYGHDVGIVGERLADDVERGGFVPDGRAVGRYREHPDPALRLGHVLDASERANRVSAGP